MCVYVCIHSFIHLLLSLCFFFLFSFLYISFFVSLLCSCFLFSVLISVLQSRVSIVGIVTRIRSGRPTNLGSIPGGRKRFLSSLKRPDWPSIPASFQFNASPLLKRLGREAYHSAHLVQSLNRLELYTHAAMLRTQTASYLLSFCFQLQGITTVSITLCSVMRYKSGRMATTCLFWRGLFAEAHYPNYNQLPQLIERPLFTSLSALFR